MNRPCILEDTCRDSLYVSNFLVEPERIAEFALRIFGAGLEYIEVGHPLGLGAHRKFSSGFTDDQLFAALGDILRTRKVFCFFIPGIGEVADVGLAKECGLYGVRVGMNAREVPDNYAVIEAVKAKGLRLSLNLMKTYATDPVTLARSLRPLARCVDIVYIVDSAGCMLPEDVRTYMKALRDEIGETAFGFHGHNNLGLAIANSLAAVECGAQYVDTTLGGIGRSAGNAPTEALLAILNKRGILQDEAMLLDVLRVSRAFREYLLSKGIRFAAREEDTLYGYAEFHSSFEEKTRVYSEEEGVDFHRLIIEVSKIDKNEVTDTALARAAQRLKESDR